VGLLVPVGPVDPAFLDFLALVLPESVGIPFRIHPRALPVDAAYEPLRGQWNAARILEELDRLEEGKEAWRVLGVADLDLFITILTFVFGLAHLGARLALVSLHRLRNEFYGLPPNPELLLARLEKEAMHELGHTARLVHCPDYACVMHFSNAVEEVDLKEARFCPTCRGKM
jgi:archaemetzincin